MPRNIRLDTLRGMILLLAVHAIVLVTLYLLARLPIQVPFGEFFKILFIVVLFGISFTQLLYVIPLCLRLRRRRQLAMMKGVIMGAIITALIHGCCFIWPSWFLSAIYYR